MDRSYEQAHDPPRRLTGKWCSLDAGKPPEAGGEPAPALCLTEWA
ncbi:hypothetical protein [Streptomyces sp. NPDC089799]